MEPFFNYPPSGHTAPDAPIEGKLTVGAGKSEVPDGTRALCDMCKEMVEFIAITEPDEVSV